MGFVEPTRLKSLRRGLIRWVAGFRALVAVSAPTALAAAIAERAGLQLAGFARDGSLEIYVA